MEKKNILVAEDEIIISLDLKTLLQKNNFEVTSTVATGEELINQYFQNKPDLIIADLELKGKMTGWDAIAEIRKTANTPIIIISGSLKSKIKQFVNNIPNTEFLPKPFEQSDLIHLANKLI